MSLYKACLYLFGLGSKKFNLLSKPLGNWGFCQLDLKVIYQPRASPRYTLSLLKQNYISPPQNWGVQSQRIAEWKEMHVFCFARNFQMALQSRGANAYSHCWSSCFLTSSPSFGVTGPLNICCGDGREVRVHCWLGLHFTNYQRGWAHAATFWSVGINLFSSRDATCCDIRLNAGLG